MGLLRKGKCNTAAKFHRTDLAIVILERGNPGLIVEYRLYMYSVQGKDVVSEKLIHVKSIYPLPHSLYDYYWRKKFYRKIEFSSNELLLLNQPLNI